MYGPDCNKPKDEARIAREKKECWKRFKGKSRQRQDGGGSQQRQDGGGRPRHLLGADGKPRVLNKDGCYVYDQKALRELGYHTKQGDATDKDKQVAEKDDKTPSQSSAAHQANLGVVGLEADVAEQREKFAAALDRLT